MTDAAPYLYEFLYRGRSHGSTEPPDYHVVLAQDVQDAFGTTHTSISAPMTPDQAKAKGFDLPAIIASIDTAVMTENASLKAANSSLKAKIDANPDSASASAAPSASN